MEAHLVVPLDMDSLFPEEIARVAAGIIAHVICSTCEGNQMGKKGGCSLCGTDGTIRLAYCPCNELRYLLCRHFNPSQA